MNFILTCQISLKTGPGVILIGKEKFHRLRHEKILNIFITNKTSRRREHRQHFFGNNTIALISAPPLLPTDSTWNLSEILSVTVD